MENNKLTPEQIEAQKKERKAAVDAAEKAWKDCPVDSPENVVKSMDLHAAYLKAQGEAEVKNFEEKLAAIEAAAKEAKDADAAKLKEIGEKLDITIKALDVVQVRVKSQGVAAPVKEKSFNETLAETIEANADKIKNFRSGEDLKLEMKAPGDMSYATNFPTGSTFTQDIRGLVQRPHEQVWLGDILPNGVTDSASVVYPQENGGEGAPAVWTGPGVKPIMDFDFTSQTAFVKWIAGIVRVPREMLDDSKWLTSFLQQRMLRSLKIAENDFILNGAIAPNAVTGLLAAAEPYDGAYTATVDRIIDASWGQIVENDYKPTHVVLGPRAAVNIGLNKASGSGEYDLPGGSVVFQNGMLQLAGLDAVTTKLMSTNFLAMDKNGASFIRRLQPELRMFEQDVDNVQRNMITFRIEERATLAIFAPGAFVTGALTGA